VASRLERGTRVERARQTAGVWAGGTTLAIYADPPETIQSPAMARAWIRTAVIERAAAYSYFAGRTRIHMPIAGNGIRLHMRSPDELVALDRFAQSRFDGARPVEVELVDGPVVAFNLIFEGSLAAEARALRLDRQATAVDLPAPAIAQAGGQATMARVVYVVDGAVELWAAGQAAVRLDADDAFVFHRRGGQAVLDDRSELRLLTPQAAIVVATLMKTGEFEGAWPAQENTSFTS
jgi:environmental stress-induced protein Ves